MVGHAKLSSHVQLGRVSVVGHVLHFSESCVAAGPTTREAR